jgi:hypothetical protein
MGWEEHATNKSVGQYNNDMTDVNFKNGGVDRSKRLEKM